MNQQMDEFSQRADSRMVQVDQMARRGITL